MKLEEDVTLYITDFESTGVDIVNDYPIEVGILVVNAKLQIQEVYSAMPRWIDCYRQCEKAGDWLDKWQPAAEVHKISVEEYIQESEDIDLICGHIIQLTDKHKTDSRKPRHILVSDNAQFEFNFMQKLFSASDFEFPFHYCAWDTSLLLEMTGIGDPRNVAHRALSDCYGLYRNLVMASYEIGYIKSEHAE